MVSDMMLIDIFSKTVPCVLVTMFHRPVANWRNAEGRKKAAGSATQDGAATKRKTNLHESESAIPDLESELARRSTGGRTSQWTQCLPSEHSRCYGTQTVKDSISEFTKSELNGELIPTPACEQQHLMRTCSKANRAYTAATSSQ